MGLGTCRGQGALLGNKEVVVLVGILKGQLWGMLQLPLEATALNLKLFDFLQWKMLESAEQVGKGSSHTTSPPGPFFHIENSVFFAFPISLDFLPTLGEDIAAARVALQTLKGMADQEREQEAGEEGTSVSLPNIFVFQIFFAALSRKERKGQNCCREPPISKILQGTRPAFKGNSALISNVCILQVARWGRIMRRKGPRATGCLTFSMALKAFTFWGWALWGAGSCHSFEAATLVPN